MQRDTVDHCLDMSRHVVRTFGIMHPTGVGRRYSPERRDKIGLHIRIGVLLNDHRSRGVADIGEQHAVVGTGLTQECRDIARDLDEPLAARLDRKRRAGNQIRAETRHAVKAGCHDRPSVETS